MPDASVAVYVTIVSPERNTSPGMKFEVSVTLQASLAVGGVHVRVVSHSLGGSSAYTSAVGQLFSTGSVTSRASTMNSQVAVLPLSSVAVYVTVIGTPPWKLEPGVSVLVISTTASHKSVAVGGIQSILTEHSSGASTTTVSDGQPASNGACASLTIMLKVHSAKLLHSSKAAKVTVVVPAGKTSPEL